MIIIKDKTPITNKFNINEIISIGTDEEYRVVGMSLDTLSNKCKVIWYKLYRLSDGYVCKINSKFIE